MTVLPVLAAALLVVAQAPRDPGRRPPPEPAGTAVVRGRVVAADTGNPIRRATVNLSMMPSPTAPVTTQPAGAPGAAPVRTVTQTMVISGVATPTSTGVIASRSKS